MLLYNPYTRKRIDYPLDLSPNNIVLDYHIEHETCFCAWRSHWVVAQLLSGDVIYIPYGERNRRDIYVVTPFYLNHTVSFPHGVYTFKYNEFMRESQLNFDDYIFNDACMLDDDDNDFYIDDDAMFI